jgi:uncharacterized protein YkwD
LRSVDPPRHRAGTDEPVQNRQHARWIAWCCTMLAIAGACRVTAVHADLLDNLNQLRHRDCAQASQDLPRLRRSTELDAVALEWSKGGRLAEALSRKQYATNRSASMQVSNTTKDVKITQLLRENYCHLLTEPVFSAVGLYRRSDHVWIVIAAPIVLPTSSDAAAVQSRVLELVNEARSQARTCGDEAFPAAKQLRASTALAAAALAHAQDMAQHSHFQHRGTDGSMPGDRATRAGYRWSSVAENIASGITTAEDVVKGWLDSPGHCANIMRPQFTEMGVAYFTDLSSKHRIYWAQVFGVPR